MERIKGQAGRAAELPQRFEEQAGEHHGDESSICSWSMWMER